jgi:hypothetical protein
MSDPRHLAGQLDEACKRVQSIINKIEKAGHKVYSTEEPRDKGRSEIIFEIHTASGEVIRI